MLLRIEDLTKTFPGVVANDRLSLDIAAGTIHAILGENGAGKSTLMNMLYGLLQPDGGRLLWKGELVTIASPRDAMRLGIGMVHQHFKLVPALTVLENVVLGERFGLRSQMANAEARLRALAAEFRQPIDPHALVEGLSVGERQRVEILKALYHDAELLVLDEPTASLTPQETGQLFAMCRSLRDRGKSVIFITHKLAEVLALSDRVTVLRAGRAVATVSTRDCDEATLARLMVGEEVAIDLAKTDVQPGQIVLDVDGLSTRQRRDGVALGKVSLLIRAGEIVGLAGVDGNGQDELVEALLGLVPIESGTVRLYDRDITGLSTGAILQSGVAEIPADRHAAAVIHDLSLVDNALLTFSHSPRFAVKGWLKRGSIRRFAGSIVEQFRVKTPSLDAPMGNLSGGNQQRFVFGRALGHDPNLLIAAQPTRGLDIASSTFVRRMLLRLREAGKAILLVSMDLDEVMALSDRIAVMCSGRIVGTLRPSAGREAIGLLMVATMPPLATELAT